MIIEIVLAGASLGCLAWFVYHGDWIAACLAAVALVTTTYQLWTRYLRRN